MEASKINILSTVIIIIIKICILCLFFYIGERNRRRRCQVAFSYLPQNEDELELKVGDIIEVVGEVSSALAL